MKENFDAFFDELIKHEGGFTDDERDPGNQRGDGHGNKGSTNLGVTAIVWTAWTGKPAPIEVMKQLTKEDIKPMYKAKYWDAVQGDHFAFWCRHLSCRLWCECWAVQSSQNITAGSHGNTRWQDWTEDTVDGVQHGAFNLAG